MGGLGRGVGYATKVTGGGGGGGTVTSVGLTAPGMFNVTGSPVTTAGSLGLELSNQNPNTVFAGPVSIFFPPGPPTFRALVAEDIPPLPYASLSGLTNNMLIKASGPSSGVDSRVWDNGSDRMAFGTNATLAAGFQFRIATDKNLLFYSNGLGITALAAVTNAGGIPAFSIDGSPLLLNASSGGNVGIKISTNPTESLQVSGNITASGTIYAKQFFTNSALPAVTLGAGAGTGALSSISGTNQSGLISITMGTGSVAFGDLFELTYSGGFAYPNSSFLNLSAINTAAALFLADTTTDGGPTTAKYRVGVTPPAAGILMQFAYIGSGF